MNNKSNDEIFRRKCANGRMRFRTKSKIAWYCSDNFEEVDANKVDLNTFITRIPYPVVVKPSREGSSVGVSIVNDPQDLSDALKLAAKSDYEILIDCIVRDLESAEVA